MLTREQILGKTELAKEKVKIEQWGGEVYVRELMGDERDTMEEDITKNSTKGLRAKLAVMCVVDAKGNQIFQKGDESALSKGSSKPLDKVFATVTRLSGLTKDAEEKAEKN